MKKLLVILVFSMIASHVYSQSWLNSNRLLSDSEVVLIDSDIDTSASVIIYGYFTGTLTASSGEFITSYGGRDYFVVKFDSLSNVLWLKNLGSSGNDYVDGGMAVNEDGSIYITGGFRNVFNYTPTNSITSTGGFDTYLLKYDTDGNVDWIKHSGQGPLNQRPNALETDDAGDIIVGGFFADSISFDGEGSLKSNNSIDDFYYAKFSQLDGSFIWAKQLRGIDNIASGRIVSISSEASSYAFVGLYYDSISIGIDTLVSLDNSIDVFVLNTDLDGNVNWIREISGTSDEYSYSVYSDDVGSVYLGGYFNGSPLLIDSTEFDQIEFDQYVGGFDIVFLKFSSDGTLQWVNATGGSGTDKIWDIDPQASQGMITGTFTGSMMWGGIELTANGSPSDVDMFVGVLDENGAFLGANSYGGRNDSREEGRAVFENNGKTYTVLRSDSDLIELGDSSYVSGGGVFYLILGVIGCQTVNIDLVNPTDLTCYNDSSGSIVVIASGGFGAPYKFSMDDGDSYHSNNGLFNNVPAGEYQIKVIDKEHCIGTGPSGIITQPDSIQFTFSTTDPACADSLFGSFEFDTPTGGSNTGWEFSVDSGATYQSAALFEDLLLDNYYLMVRENNDCKSSIIDTIFVIPDPITFEFDVENDSLLCFGDTEGAFHFKNVAGGIGVYEYSINVSPAYGPDTFFLSLGANDYSLVVRDENNCVSITVDTSIYQPAELVLNLLDSAHIMGDTDGFIEVEAVGGILPYIYRIQESGAEQESETSHTFTFTKGEEGTYTVEVTDVYGCGPSAIGSIEIAYIPGVGVEKSNLLLAKIYPNPTSGMITLEMPFEGSECTLEVLSLAGQVVMSRRVYPNGGELNESIDLQSLAKGMYMLRIDGKMLRSGIVLK